MHFGAGPLGEPFLQVVKHRHGDFAHPRATGKERSNHHDFAAEKIAVQSQLLSVLIGKLDIGEIPLRRCTLRGFIVRGRRHHNRLRRNRLRFGRGAHSEPVPCALVCARRR